MGNFGNPLAFELGGGASEQEGVYTALRSSVGEGNYTPGKTPQESLMEAWRYARARGIVAAFADGRAVAQYFPDLATDMLPMYEQILRLPVSPGESEQERRDAAIARWTRVVTAAMPTLEARLQAIDPRLSFVTPDRDLLREVQHGRSFEDWDPTAPDASGPAFGLYAGPVGSKASAFPNFSDDFRFFVRLNIGPGNTPTQHDLRVIEDVKSVMSEAMPAWCDLVVFYTGSGQGEPCGFVLDTDFLDLTIFCS